MFVFSPSLTNSWSARICSRLPLRISRLITSITWGTYYLLNWRQIRSTIAPTVARATNSSSLKANVVGICSAASLGNYVTDAVFFMRSPAERIRRRISACAIMADPSPLAQAINDGKGAILVSSNFSCFYYALMSERKDALRDMDVAIVQPVESVQGAGAQEFRKKISQTMGQELQIIESGSLRAGIEMVAALKRGAVVACLIDFFPPRNTSLAITTFLGQPSCQATGISSISAMTKAPVIPCFTFFEKGKFVTRFMSAIPAPATNSSDDILEMCDRIDAQLTDVILSRPHQWASWISVPNKWNAAAEMLQQFAEAEDATV